MVGKSRKDILEVVAENIVTQEKLFFTLLNKIMQESMLL